MREKRLLDSITVNNTGNTLQSTCRLFVTEYEGNMNMGQYYS